MSQSRSLPYLGRRPLNVWGNGSKHHYIPVSTKPCALANQCEVHCKALPSWLGYIQSVALTRPGKQSQSVKSHKHELQYFAVQKSSCEVCVRPHNSVLIMVQGLPEITHAKDMEDQTWERVRSKISEEVLRKCEAIHAKGGPAPPPPGTCFTCCKMPANLQKKQTFYSIPAGLLTCLQSKLSLNRTRHLLHILNLPHLVAHCKAADIIQSIALTTCCAVAFVVLLFHTNTRRTIRCQSTSTRSFSACKTPEYLSILDTVYSVCVDWKMRCCRDNLRYFFARVAIV